MIMIIINIIIDVKIVSIKFILFFKIIIIEIISYSCIYC